MTPQQVARAIAVLVSVAFAAGAVGGIANFLIAPICGYAHITTGLGVAIAPPFDKADLYQKVFWGGRKYAGVWGLMFCIPFHKHRQFHWLPVALLLGIPPTLVQLFLIFPLGKPSQGIAGVNLGAATPVFVLLFNTLGWSIPAYSWFLMVVNGGTGGNEYEDAAADFVFNPLLG